MENTINKLSKELSLSQEVIKKVYKAYWTFIRHTIENLPLKKDLSEEEFNKLRTNFNIPNLGKLSCTYKRYVGKKIRNNTAKELKNAKHKENNCS